MVGKLTVGKPRDDRRTSPGSLGDGPDVHGTGMVPGAKLATSLGHLGGAARRARSAVRSLSKPFALSAFAVALSATTMLAPSAAHAAGLSRDPVVVAATPLPDLRVSTFISKASPLRGETVDITVVPHNAGAGAAGSTRVMIGMPSSFSDLKLKSAPGLVCRTSTTGGFVPGLWLTCDGGQFAPNTIKQLIFSVNVGQVAGAYSLVTAIDLDRVIAESDESNNASTLRMVVSTGIPHGPTEVGPTPGPVLGH